MSNCSTRLESRQSVLGLLSLPRLQGNAFAGGERPVIECQVGNRRRAEIASSGDSGSAAFDDSTSAPTTPVAGDSFEFGSFSGKS
jgi:hypothetical protein